MKVLSFTALLVGLSFASLGIAAQQGVNAPVATPGSVQLPVRGAAPAPLTQTPVPASYVIGPEDNISVTVWKEPTLSGAFPVRPDGMISLALVGDIPASGRTPMQLANDLTARLKNFVNDPTVTVTVLAVNSKKIYILGEVQHIGALPLTSDLTLLQAIASAGGLTPYAHKSHIYILRGRQGAQKKIPFNYNKAIKDGNQQGITLLPDDTIVVP